ncbi:MAG: dTMP kinase [Succinivibrio sp.]|jgi:dTMP kinase|nr:dTMP kinase [Succinivibrio sp.]
MKKGLFITLEGTEGSGKSTQIAVIKAHMEAKGHKVVCLREPGGTPIAEEIRTLLKTPRKDDNMCDKTELLLMYAARAQLVETVIKPLLAQGTDVICDRHDLSTVAYQGGGRGMNMDDINAIRKVVLGDFRPDLTIVIDVDPKIGMQRARNRGELDRFELSQIDFFERVRNTYLEYAKHHPEFVKVVDGQKEILAVSKDVISCLDNLNA